MKKMFASLFAYMFKSQLMVNTLEWLNGPSNGDLLMS